jgi:hypothetical protein
MAAKAADAGSIEFVIDSQGNTRHILDEDNARAYEPLGRIEDIYRSSHVETWQSLSLHARHRILGNKEQRQWHSVPTAFWADLTPVGGPVLGPFASRKNALAAEVHELKALGLPLPTVKKTRIDGRHGGGAIPRGRYKESQSMKPNPFRWHVAPSTYMIAAGAILLVIAVLAKLVSILSS